MYRTLFIVNPVSGSRKGPSIMEQALELFEKNEQSVTVRTSLHPGHAQQIVFNEDLSEYRGIAVIGGDGTMHEVVNGLMNRTEVPQLPVGIIPAGTGNSLAHDLGVLDPKDAINVILNGRHQSLDIARIEMNEHILYAFNVIGWGVPTDINKMAERMRWLGGHRYNIASLVEIFINRRRRIKLRFDGNSMDQALSFVVACNTMYTGNGMRMAPSALLDDGKIDLLVVSKIGRFELLKLFTKVFAGKHLPHPLLQYHQVSTFEIECDKPMPLNIDGQITGTAPCKVSMIPRVLQLFVRTTRK